MKILGISAFYHDSAAAIVVDDQIIAAGQEERFTRKKHDAAFPTNAVKYCLEESGIRLSELDAIAFYDKPFLKFERLLETYYAFSPRGLASFIQAVPVWVKEKLFLKKNILKSLQAIEGFDVKKVALLFPEHHLSHSSSAYYPSPFNEAAILTIDGVGEWATASISHGKGNKIEVLKELHFPHSLGLLYSAFTYYLGFRVNSGEYKMMGLAPYGNKESQDYARFRKVILDNLIDIKEDGSIWLNQSYFNYATGLRMVFDKKWEKLFGLKRRSSEEPILQAHMDMALVIQHITEEVVIKLAQEAKRLTQCDHLTLAGGVALNCVANGKLIDAQIFEKVWIQPAAGDAGGALGAALAAAHIYFDRPLAEKSGKDNMQGSYLGPSFSGKEIESVAKKFKAPFEKLNEESDFYNKVTDLIASGNVIGWFQGRMEFGPRALGHRSIIADARNTEMQLKLNLKIKYRESFRPFAPSVLKEDVGSYFQHEEESPYMLIVKPVQDDLRKEVPANYSGLPLMEKIKVERSTLPAITHVDFSARIQTVDGTGNPTYHRLLKTFKEKTGFGVLINTSFNVRGEPIVCTPEDAYRCFMRTEMDYLVLNEYIFEKQAQPNWSEKDRWEEEFELD